MCFAYTWRANGQGQYEERKDSVKKVLHDLNYAASRATGKAFRKITEKHMADAGMSIAFANATPAELESLQAGPL